MHISCHINAVFKYFTIHSKKDFTYSQVAVALNKLNDLVNERADERDETNNGVRREVSQWERDEWWSVSTAGMAMNYDHETGNCCF